MSDDFGHLLAVVVLAVIGEVSGGGLATPKPMIVDNIFFQNGISTWDYDT